MVANFSFHLALLLLAELPPGFSFTLGSQILQMMLSGLNIKFINSRIQIHLKGNFYLVQQQIKTVSPTITKNPGTVIPMNLNKV